MNYILCQKTLKNQVLSYFIIEIYKNKKQLEGCLLF